MELLLDNAAIQIYILHTAGYIQVIQDLIQICNSWIETFSCRTAILFIFLINF